MDIKKITNFIFEMSQLKHAPHNGWLLAGVKDPEKIASHTMRAAQIGYILATMEGGVNPERVACIVLVHDNAEARILDKHKVSARYLETKKAEMAAFVDQIDGLGDEIEKKWKIYFEEFENRNTKEGIIAKDADWLEQSFQAKEYADSGYKSAQNWIDNVEKALETDSAKKLLKQMKKTEFSDWWEGLKKMTYKKLDS